MVLNVTAEASPVPDAGPASISWHLRVMKPLPPSRGRQRGVELLQIPDNYYDDVRARFDLDPKFVGRLRESGILYDRTERGEFRTPTARRSNGRFSVEPSAARRATTATGARTCTSGRPRKPWRSVGAPDRVRRTFVAVPDWRVTDSWRGRGSKVMNRRRVTLAC